MGKCSVEKKTRIVDWTMSIHRLSPCSSSRGFPTVEGILVQQRWQLAQLPRTIVVRQTTIGRGCDECSSSCRHEQFLLLWFRVPVLALLFVAEEKLYFFGQKIRNYFFTWTLSSSSRSGRASRRSREGCGSCRRCCRLLEAKVVTGGKPR
jgi:hypothetical protein